MTALELADAIDNVGPKNSKWDQAAAMLRAQYAAIRQLREALLSLDGVCSVIVWKDQYEKVSAALAATEEIK